MRARNGEPGVLVNLCPVGGLPRRFTVRRELVRSEEHTSELQSQSNLVCRLLLEKKKYEFEPHSSWSSSCQGVACERARRGCVRIIDGVPVGVGLWRCARVDAPSHLYVCTCAQRA